MSIEENRIVVDREGVVYAGTASPLSMRGYVDKYRPVKAATPWRGIKEGGREQRGFRTRKEAAEWVVKP